MVRNTDTCSIKDKKSILTAKVWLRKGFLSNELEKTGGEEK